MTTDAYKQSGSSPTATEVKKCPVSGKRSFETEDEAAQFEQRNRQEYNLRQQYPYACEDCPTWHLTATPPGTASMARTHLPAVPESKTESRHTGPKGIATAEVVRLRSSGMTLEAIANRLGVSIPSVKYHLDKTGGRERTSMSSVISLDEISRKKAELEGQLAALTQAQERLLENARMKVQFVGGNILIKKNGEQVTISISDANTLFETLTTEREAQS